ncbi:hypothetical protein C8R45DRAFT_1104178 [Mycena sanguinolenta]|nr:hypothetical protein C8R45DRAFT_1104178 [Mycena sanguinolenta]
MVARSLALPQLQLLGLSFTPCAAAPPRHTRDGPLRSEFRPATLHVDAVCLETPFRDRHSQRHVRRRPVPRAASQYLQYCVHRDRSAAFPQLRISVRVMPAQDRDEAHLHRVLKLPTLPQGFGQTLDPPRCAPPPSALRFPFDLRLAALCAAAGLSSGPSVLWAVARCCLSPSRCRRHEPDSPQLASTQPLSVSQGRSLRHLLSPYICSIGPCDDQRPCCLRCRPGVPQYLWCDLRCFGATFWRDNAPLLQPAPITTLGLDQHT